MTHRSEIFEHISDESKHQTDDDWQVSNRCSHLTTPAWFVSKGNTYDSFFLRYIRDLEKEPEISNRSLHMLSDSRSFEKWWQVGDLKADTKPTCKTVPVQSFYPEAIVIIKPFSVVVSWTGEDFVATFYDANLNASGDTDEEAFSNLKDVIVATFELLTLSRDNLGPGPRMQLGVLEEFIKRAK